MSSIQYDFETNRFVYNGRFSDFSSEIANKLHSSRKNNTAICHRVSFYFIAKALINPLNFYICNLPTETPMETLAGETVCYIIGIILAVSGAFPDFLDLSNQFINSFLESNNEGLKNYQFYIKNLLSNLLQPPTRDVEEIGDFMLIAEGYLNRILEDLNNEEFNLKIGNASWNSSISNAFDCFEKKEACSGDKFIIEGTDSQVLSILINMTKPGGDNFDVSELFIYTALIVNEEGKELILLCQSCRTESVKECQEIDPYFPIIYKNPYDNEYHILQTGEVVQPE